MGKYGLVLFAMLLAAPIAVEGTIYYIALKMNEDGNEERYPIQDFKDSEIASGIMIKDTEEEMGILYVKATEEQAKKLKKSVYVEFVQEDEMGMYDSEGESR